MLDRASAAYSRFNRRQKARRFRGLIAHHNVKTVLLVGAESATFSWSNIVENAILSSGARVVVSGLGPELDFPNTLRVFCDGRALPFRDGAFDLVLSNAVVEHVGDEADQRVFLAEHYRVGRRYVATTPNRWFPVESHTRVLFRHWVPAWRDRHSAAFSRLLSRRELARVLPGHEHRIRGRWFSPTFTVDGLGLRYDDAPRNS